MKKKILPFLIALAALVPQASAWGGGLILGSESYLSFGVLGGPGGLMFNGSVKEPSSMGFTFGFNVNYTCYINNYIGFSTGVHINRMSSGYYESDVLSYGTGNVQVGDGSTLWTVNARYHLKTGRVDETYKTYFVEVPVLLAMQYRKWYWNMGLKVAVPVAMHADYTYDKSDLYLDEVLGSGTVLSNPLHVNSYDGASGEVDLYDKQRHQLLMFYVMASAEIGYNVAFYGGASSLSVGVFMDMSVNSAKLNNAANTASITLNTNELYYHNSVQTDKVKSVGCFKAGIKLQYNLGIGQGARRSTRGLRYL
ncbi:MAG: hypothetical protein AUK63_127 [bacterium P3]|nr:MAG: hypothetical protein AUK63_127 [bacterium P3]KWW42410.1 MAG: hypothetical protein F083_314 [bacterium F083]